MTVEEALEKAVARLHAGQLTNEAQIKQAIVIPILRALDWDDTDPNEVKPDHRVRDGNAGSVDYALFQEGNALIFIIASPQGNVTPSGVEPIFELSARNGVPFLIVTDGKTWDFFLGKAVGIPQERRFLRIELRPDRIDKNAHLFSRFLRKGSVSGKQAILEAERLLSHDRDRRIAQNAIPDVWTSLVDDDDDQATVDPVFRETLYDVIKDAVRERCGSQPANEDVKGFLKGLSKYRPDKSDACQTEESGPVSPSGFNLVRWRHNNKIVGFDFDGMPTITNAASRTLAELVRRFQEIDPDFIACLKERTTTNRRRLVARRQIDLYNQPTLSDRSEKLLDGVRDEMLNTVEWYIGTNYPQNQIMGFIETACEIMEIEIGDDRIIDH